MGWLKIIAAREHLLISSQRKHSILYGTAMLPSYKVYYSALGKKTTIERFWYTRQEG